MELSKLTGANPWLSNKIVPSKLKELPREEDLIDFDTVNYLNIAYI
jgi:hypothetical protein